MSLLQGLIGFGAGAAQSLAETKQQDMAAARQANLARLQAQYKGEMEASAAAAAAQNRTKIYDLFQTDPEAAERLAFTSGVDISDIVGGSELTTASQTREQRIVSLMRDLNLNRAEAVRFLELGEQDRYNEYNDDAGNLLREDKVTGQIQQLVGKNWITLDGDEQQPRETSVEQTPISLRTDAPSRTQELIESRTTETATGPSSVVERGAIRIPIFGEIVASRVGNFAKDAVTGRQFISRINNSLRAEAARGIQDEGGRLTNMILEMVKDVEVKQGILTTPESMVRDFIAIRREALREYERAIDTASNPNVSPEQRTNAIEYMNKFKPILDDMAIVITTHEAGKINVSYSAEEGQTEAIFKVPELTYDELLDITRQYRDGERDLTEKQRFAIFDMINLYQSSAQ